MSPGIPHFVADSTSAHCSSRICWSFFYFSSRHEKLCSFSHIQFLLIFSLLSPDFWSCFSIIVFYVGPFTFSLSFFLRRCSPHSPFCRIHKISCSCSSPWPSCSIIHEQTLCCLNLLYSAGCSFSFIFCSDLHNSVPLILQSHGFFRRKITVITECTTCHRATGFQILSTLVRYEGNNDSSLPVWLPNQYSLWLDSSSNR